MLALALTLALAGGAAAEPAVTLPREEVLQLLDAYRLVKSQYVDTVDDKKLLAGAIAGMLSSLDPHSRLLDQDDLLDLEKTESGEFVGIGLEVSSDRGRMEVTGVTAPGPAQRAGILARDVIVSIDGAAVSGLALPAVLKRMRGPAGSRVSLGVARGGAVALRTVEVERAQLHNTTVELHRLAGGLAWLRVSEFGGATGADLAALLQSLDGGAKGLILDLRNNPGGLVTAAVDVAAAFLAPDALVLTARARNPAAQDGAAHEIRTPAAAGSTPAWARTVPLAVLVNGETVSAAELLAGALQDQHRATVIGTPTFGKGSIQGIIALSGSSAIKLTVARYYTPGGREIQARGIAPDVLVAPARAATARDALLLREADLANHLPGTVPAPAADRVAVEIPASFGGRDDKAMQAALRTLAAGVEVYLGK
jgi:carboxyl-terminal processing protease